MVMTKQNAFISTLATARSKPDEGELRAEFIRQHKGRNLKQHKTRGTYRRADIQALWNQHCRTAEWMASRATLIAAAKLSIEGEVQERSGFEKKMREEGSVDFKRRPSGRYENMVLEWHWLGWQARARWSAGL